MATSIVSPKDVTTGSTVQVTIADAPQQVVTGTVIAVATYDVAKSMNADLPSKHAAIQAISVNNGANVLPEVDDETFFILDTGGTRPVVVAFDWILKLELVEKGANYRIKLLNCSKADADKAIAILRANNMACQLDVLY